MQIKKYRARSLTDALQQVRAELGEQALILDTKRLGNTGVGALLGRTAVEVTAARDTAPPSANSDDQNRLLRSRAASIENYGGGAAPANMQEQESELRLESIINDEAIRARGPARKSFAERAYAQNAPATRTTRAASDRSGVSALREELRAVKANLNRLASAVKAGEREFANPILRLLHQRWRESGVEAEVAGSIIQALSVQVPADDVGEPRALRAALAGVLEKHLHFSGRLRSRSVGTTIGQKRSTVIALVGPTGVGKTTTIAKLAANMKIYERTRVGLLSVDTYRLAAIDQLRSFALIADLPLQIAYTPEEAAAALHRLSFLDVIFVDTAGRSPRHQEHLDQLHEFTRAMHPDQIHLVISATTKPVDLRLITQQFAATRFDHLIITKTDETRDLAALLNLHKLGDVPISHFTTGQNIPEDVVTADALLLSDWILSGAGF